MSKPHEGTDPTLPASTPKPEKRPSSGPWDPFRYLIKTISPQQRAELWRLQVPILPQEEFMTTDERRRARMARLRRPVIIGAGAFLVVLAGLGLWWRASASRAPLASSLSLPAVLPPVTTSAIHASLEPHAASALPKADPVPQGAQAATVPTTLTASASVPASASAQKGLTPALNSHGAKPSGSSSHLPSSVVIPPPARDSADQPFMPAAQ